MSNEALQQIREFAVGKPLADVIAKAKPAGWAVRIMRENGKRCLGTCDHNPGRINVAVENGQVIEVISLG